MSSDSLKNILKAYRYIVAPSLIATHPAKPRDSARLLVWNKKQGSVSVDTFRNLSNYLPPHTVLVFNNTKVLPARLTLKKDTGGLVRILYLSHDAKEIRCLADRPFAIGSTVRVPEESASFKVNKKDGAVYYLVPSFPTARMRSWLYKKGRVPIPPYIKNTPLSEAQLKQEYQTIFARVAGSVAAPTASLHFTKRLLKQLSHAGIAQKLITLHVGLGTFAPITDAQLLTRTLHEEHFELSPKTLRFLNQAKKQGRPIIAVGTTSVRTLESAANDKGILAASHGDTRLFIREGYEWKFIDGMITNFHVPASSLMMLVAAFIGRKKLLSLYYFAIKKKFRLFSFGDGMLLY